MRYPIRSDETRAFVRWTEESYFIEVSIPRDIPVVDGNVNEVKLVGEVNIDGFDTDFEAVFSRAYTSEDMKVAGLSDQWDSPSVKIGSFDCAGSYELPWEMRALAARIVYFMVQEFYLLAVKGK